ncbi:unnamed protein product [Linum tenue]|uniref:Uncharacterized protein n=1 Tax=Linum tenue TaxID=586396 RepID=A0AAV0RZJ4_9ROSI|nr:unnamed protein product [Linum tenue]
MILAFLLIVEIRRILRQRSTVSGSPDSSLRWGERCFPGSLSICGCEAC